MTPDVMLVLGIIIAALSLPSIYSALSDRRAPRTSAVALLIAVGLIIFAIMSNPGGYQLTGVPDAFIRVIAQIMH